MSASPVLERPRVAQGEGSPSGRTAVLYERYYDRVFGYCLYKLGNRQEAEDAAQTTFLWVLRGLERGIEPRMEANWLFTIAQNACRARIKARGRRREQETLSDPQVLERVAPGRVGVAEDLVGLEEALRGMPELQRQAIILREWRGFSYKEIAAELDLSAAAVETLIFRARRSLASRLENPAVRPAKTAGALAINLGPFSSAIKSLLGFGSAAKATAVVATVAALAIGIGVGGDTPATHQVRTPSLTQKAVTRAEHPAQHPPAAMKDKKGPKHREHTVQQTAPSSSDSDSGPANTPSSPAVGGVVDQVTTSVPPAGDLVGNVLDEVDSVTAAVDDTLDPVVPVESPLP